ncbi:MAG: ABC transporter substrate-binding protein [Hyphomicrobiales bacterium]|jgi:peptide/nickel transport system substrate-binding protein|nr:ABC transporter substrate-binding protein [Hyphomicrobiales bacterium]
MLTRRSLITAAGALALPARTAAQDQPDLRIGLAFEPSSFDPHFHNTTPNKSLGRSVFEPLLFQDERQAVRPGLATGWRLVDPLTWEFALRPGVRWHDGAAFGADDIVFTFERAPAVPRSPSSFAGFIAGKTVEKIDDLTIRVRTAEPYPQMPIDLSTFGIVPASTRGATSDDYNTGKAAIGTGPFRFGGFVRGDRTLLLRNETYWGGVPPWRRVLMRVLRSDPTRVAALLAGDVDLIETVPTADLARLRGDPRFTVTSIISNRVIYLAMDQFRDESPFIKGPAGEAVRNPLKDARVRRSLSHAINRQALVDRVMEGDARPASQFLDASFFGASRALGVPAYDIGVARSLLADAGFPNGFRLKMHGPQGRYANDTKLIEAIAQMFTRIGIQTEIETLPPAIFFTRGSTGGPGNTPEFSMIMAGWGSAAGEMSDPLRNLAATFDAAAGRGSSNRGRYTNPAVDTAINTALATIDDTARSAALARAMEQVADDMGIIPVLYPLNTWAARRGLGIAARSDEYTLPFHITRPS